MSVHVNVDVDIESLPVISMARRDPCMVEIKEGDFIWRHLATTHEDLLKICLFTLRRRNKENRYRTVEEAKALRDNRLATLAEETANNELLNGVTDEIIASLPQDGLGGLLKREQDKIKLQERKIYQAYNLDVEFRGFLDTVLSLPVEEALKIKSLAPSGKRARYLVEELILRRSDNHREGFRVEYFDDYEGEN